MPPYTHLGDYIAKVDGRTEYQSVGPGNLFQITKKTGSRSVKVCSIATMLVPRMESY